MSLRALSTNAVAIALAAIYFSGSADATPLLCEDVTLHEAVQAACPDSDSYYVKNRHRIDYLFDAEMPSLALGLLVDWNGLEIKFKSGARTHREHWLHRSQPRWSSGGWSLGRISDHGGKWTHAQPHGGQPSPTVPEPDSLLLLGIGFLGAALARRFKRT